MFIATGLEYCYPKSQTLIYPEIVASTEEPLLVRGSSGCGKTSLLHLLAGLITPKAGSMYLNRQLFQPRTQAALIPQIPHLINSLTVAQNIATASWAANRTFDITSLSPLLLEVGIADLMQRKPAQLSRGQAQRVALVRALSLKPQLLLADEPTANLDDEAAFAAINLLLRQARSFASVLIVASHDGRITPFFKKILSLPVAADSLARAKIE